MQQRFIALHSQIPLLAITSGKLRNDACITFYSLILFYTNLAQIEMRWTCQVPHDFQLQQWDKLETLHSRTFLLIHKATSGVVQNLMTNSMLGSYCVRWNDELATELVMKERKSAYTYAEIQHPLNILRSCTVRITGIPSPSIIVNHSNHDTCDGIPLASLIVAAPCFHWNFL